MGVPAESNVGARSCNPFGGALTLAGFEATSCYGVASADLGAPHYREATAMVNRPRRHVQSPAPRWSTTPAAPKQEQQTVSAQCT